MSYIQWTCVKMILGWLHGGYPFDLPFDRQGQQTYIVDPPKQGSRRSYKVLYLDLATVQNFYLHVHLTDAQFAANSATVGRCMRICICGPSKLSQRICDGMRFSACLQAEKRWPAFHCTVIICI